MCVRERERERERERKKERCVNACARVNAWRVCFCWVRGVCGPWSCVVGESGKLEYSGSAPVLQAVTRCGKPFCTKAAFPSQIGSEVAFHYVSH